MSCTPGEVIIMSTCWFIYYAPDHGCWWRWYDQVAILQRRDTNDWRSDGKSAARPMLLLALSATPADRRIRSAPSAPATMSKQHYRMLQSLSTKSKQIEHVQFVSTLSQGRNFTINSFDIVAVFGNKVECCFDIVAGVDGALRTGESDSSSNVAVAQLHRLRGGVSEFENPTPGDPATQSKRHQRKQDAVGNGRVRPQCRHLANSTKHTCRLRFWPIPPLYENMITSSTNTELHNILHCRQSRIEPRPQVTYTENMVKVVWV